MKRSFTLLEMMIAIALLSLIASVTAIQIKKMIDHHRFESDVSQLFIALQEAQMLSIAYQTDIAVDLYQKEGKWHCCFSTLEPFKKGQLDQKEKNLSSIGKIQFNGKKTDPLHFDFFSGRLEPRGILALKQEEEGRELWFDLQYGQLMKFTFQKPIAQHYEAPKPS